jgi:Family of unknown function (DUF6065)
MPSQCLLCGYTGDLFKPAGSVKTDSGKRKLRACPNCGSDEWSRLVAAWLGQKQRLPRQARILALTVPLALRSHLAKIKGATLVDAETPDLAGGAFAPDAFDLIVIGENWSYESRDISIAIKLHEALRPRGWLIASPVDAKDGARKQAQLSQLGFEAPPLEGLARAQFAVAPEQPFLAAQKKIEKSYAQPAVKIDPDSNRLIWFREAGPAPEVRPAPLQRDWMDATPEKYAYRCLPLNIANAQGWELLNTASFTATWDGGIFKQSIALAFDDPAQPQIVMSHFGSGILTFSIRGLLRTPSGIDLFVTGPINRPKAGIQALTGVIETDWSEFGFTMNWLFTDKERPVRFEKDEPFATIFPIPRTLAESLDPVIMEGEKDAELWRRHMAHRLSRADFIEELKLEDSEARKKGWQRAYFNGPAETVDPEHRTKVRLKPFRKLEE